MVAAYATVLIYIIAFLYQLLSGTEIIESAEKSVKVVMLFSPILGAGAVIGLRKAETGIK